MFTFIENVHPLLTMYIGVYCSIKTWICLPNFSSNIWNTIAPPASSIVSEKRWLVPAEVRAWTYILVHKRHISKYTELLITRFIRYKQIIRPIHGHLQYNAYRRNYRRTVDGGAVAAAVEIENIKEGLGLVGGVNGRFAELSKGLTRRFLNI